MDTAKKILQILALSIVITLLITGYKALPERKVKIVASNFGGAFTLTNHLGQPVTDKDFEDQYRLLYFGFTFCPAVCPTELQRMASVLKDLGETGEQIQPIFITVDPERDTVEAMANYVDLFHPRLIGLTGTLEQTDVIKRAYKVYAAKVLEDDMSDYTVDHSSFIYFMGANNDLIQIFRAHDTVEYMVGTIRQVLKKPNLQ